MRIYNILVILLLVFSSCGRKIKVLNNELTESEFWVDLPDSVQIDSSVQGLIRYKVSDSPLKEKNLKRRYTFLYATLTKGKILLFEELKKVPHDTFAVIEENIIPIYDMKASPNAKGDVDFQGFLIEEFFYSLNNDSMRIITKERRFEKTIKLIR